MDMINEATEITNNDNYWRPMIDDVIACLISNMDKKSDAERYADAIHDAEYARVI